MRDEASIREVLDRAAIVEVIVGLANAMDVQDWARVRSLLGLLVAVAFNLNASAPGLLHGCGASHRLAALLSARRVLRRLSSWRGTRAQSC